MTIITKIPQNAVGENWLFLRLGYFYAADLLIKLHC